MIKLMAFFLGALSLLGTFNQTFAEEFEPMMLSLEELLNIEVYTPSLVPLPITQAPGVVRVFTKDDIDRGGYQTLLELLSQVPGIQISYGRDGDQLIWLRGIQGDSNSKILLLIDGTKMRSYHDGSFPIDEYLPLGNVERIEVMNGPGSVLYGSGSFAGVIKDRQQTSSGDVVVCVSREDRDLR